MPEELYTVKSYIQGPREANIKEFLTLLAWKNGLDLKIKSTINKWLGWTQTVLYEVNGPKSNLFKFKIQLEQSVKNHNA